LTVRDETEWVELVEAGWNELVAPDAADCLPAKIEAAHGREGEDGQFYGTGNAAQEIVDILTRQ
jgi:UDP-GlcNAc3NAcA epimerase